MCPCSLTFFQVTITEANVQFIFVLGKQFCCHFINLLQVAVLHVEIAPDAGAVGVHEHRKATHWYIKTPVF